MLMDFLQIAQERKVKALVDLNVGFDEATALIFLQNLEFIQTSVDKETTQHAATEAINLLNRIQLAALAQDAPQELPEKVHKSPLSPLESKTEQSQSREIMGGEEVIATMLLKKVDDQYQISQLLYVTSELLHSGALPLAEHMSIEIFFPTFKEIIESGKERLKGRLSSSKGEQYSFRFNHIAGKSKEFFFYVQKLSTDKVTQLVHEQLYTIEKIQSMLSNLIHDVKGPTGGINVQAEYLLRDIRTKGYEANDAEALFRIKKIIAYVEAMKFMMENLLDVSQLSDLPNYEKANVEEVIRSSLIAIQHTLQAKEGDAEKKALVINVRDMDKEMMIDKTRVASTVLNLVTNAVRYTHAGEITVTVGMNSSDLMIEVKDTGVGMNEEQLGKVRKKLSSLQIAPETIRDKNPWAVSTGFGLNIVCKHLNVLRGEAVVDSVEGNGTVFTVFIPLPQQ